MKTHTWTHTHTIQITRTQIHWPKGVHTNPPFSAHTDWFYSLWIHMHTTCAYHNWKSNLMYMFFMFFCPFIKKQQQPKDTNWGMILWNELCLNPKPFSYVQRHRKFSGNTEREMTVIHTLGPQRVIICARTSGSLKKTTSMFYSNGHAVLNTRIVFYVHTGKHMLVFLLLQARRCHFHQTVEITYDER